MCNNNSDNFLKKMYVNYGRVCPTFDCAYKVRSLARRRNCEETAAGHPVIRGNRMEEEFHDSPVQAICSGTKSSIRRTPSDPPPSCQWCGKVPAHERRRCPARSATCHRCSKRGHFQSVCRAPPRVSEIHTESSDEEAFLGGVTSGDSQTPWTVTLQLNGQRADFLIDTGAEVTIISEHTHNAIGSPPLSPPPRSLKGPSNHVLPVTGYFSGTIKQGTHETHQDVYVVKRLHQQLLGRPAIGCSGTSWGYIDSPRPKGRVPPAVQRFGKTQPSLLHQTPARCHPILPMRCEKSSNTPHATSEGGARADGAAGSHCKGGTANRLVCGDGSRTKVERESTHLTKLNESVRRERYPLPSVDQILAQLSGATVFSKLDANSGFWQVPLSPDSALLTTFITPFGRFCFHRLPFGISSAPEIFQRLMSQMLAVLLGTVCMMNDVLVYGAAQEEHDDHLRKVLQRIQDSGMTLNPEKCKLSCNRVKFLGHIVDEAGICPDPEKILGIVHTTTPQDISNVRRFLGTVNPAGDRVQQHQEYAHISSSPGFV